MTPHLRFALALGAAALGVAPAHGTARYADPQACDPNAPLTLPAEQIAAGAAHYEALCASCHGADATGGSALDVTGILVKDVLASAYGVGNMQPIPLEGDQAETIAAFLMSLAPDQAKNRLCRQYRRSR